MERLGVAVDKLQECEVVDVTTAYSQAEPRVQWAVRNIGEYTDVEDKKHNW